MKFDNTYIKLPATLYDLQEPEQVAQPRLVYFNAKLAQKLGLDYTPADESTIVNYFSGNKLIAGSNPLAQAYAGHQFGHFTMLGDGRAILLGEHIDNQGDRWDVQLKGAGRTKYSRGGDGRATLSAMLREYLMSEALHHLNIPTSRGLAVVMTGESVHRQVPHHGAILTRIASSHIRVGTFEYIKRFLDKETLSTFTNYVINRHYPKLASKENPALSLLEKVMDQQINLIVYWMRVGFIHGVMNTDNCTISGETIDYGPCAFMNNYDPSTVFSSIDTQGRYAYGNQPAITQWNLMCLASALLPLIHENRNIAVDQAEQLLNKFPARYEQAWLTMMRKKLGLTVEKEIDETLVNDLLTWMKENNADYTNTFADLQLNTVDKIIYQTDSFQEWYALWLKRIQLESRSLNEAQELMQTVNPFYIPRNHNVERALELASTTGDFNFMDRLLQVLTQPYNLQEGQDDLLEPPADGDSGYQTYCGT